MSTAHSTQQSNAKHGSSSPWVSRVFVVDDHPFFAGALASLINSEADLSVCGLSSKLPGCGDLVVQASPDVLVLDVNLSARNNWSLAIEIRKWSKSVPILFVSSLQNPQIELNLRWLEPCSFVEKNGDPSTIIHAVRQVLARARVHSNSQSPFPTEPTP